MAKIHYNETAVFDLAVAEQLIEEYFAGVHAPELAVKQIEILESEISRHEGLLEGNPRLFPVRRDFYFSRASAPIRSFLCHWFLVFYTYDEISDTAEIWFVRSSKSDYSNIAYML